MSGVMAFATLAQIEDVDWTKPSDFDLACLLATARAGLEPKRIDAAGNTELQPGHISDEEVGRFLTKQERDGTRWALCDFVSKRSGQGRSDG